MFLSNCSIYVAMLCAFLLGFGDSCFNTQVSAINSEAGCLLLCTIVMYWLAESVSSLTKYF